MHLHHIAAACCLVQPVNVLCHNLEVHATLPRPLLSSSQHIMGCIGLAA